MTRRHYTAGEDSALWPPLFQSQVGCMAAPTEPTAEPPRKLSGSNRLLKKGLAVGWEV